MDYFVLASYCPVYHRWNARRGSYSSRINCGGDRGMRTFKSSDGYVCTELPRGANDKFQGYYSQMFIHNGVLYGVSMYMPLQVFYDRTSKDFFGVRVCVTNQRAIKLSEPEFTEHWERDPAALAAEIERLFVIHKLRGEL